MNYMLLGVGLFLVIIIIILILKISVLATIQNQSMSPTLNPGDRVLVLKYFPPFWIRSGSIVVVWPTKLIKKSAAPLGIDNAFIKRVVGLSGDTITATIDELDEYHKGQDHTRYDLNGQRSWHIPLDHCFVRGDHPIGGFDSLSWGPIPLTCILGLVVLKIPQKTPPASTALSPRSLITRGPSVGALAANFSEQTRKGETVTLQQFAGQAVLLIFVASGCEPCRAIIKYVEDSYYPAKQHGIEILLMYKIFPSEVDNLLNEVDVAIPVLIINPDINPLFEIYNISILPFFCFIDSNGRVQSTGLPFPLVKEWSAIIENWE